MPSFKVDNYAVLMWSSRPITSAGAVVGIQLFEKRADSAGFNWRGYAYFFGDGVPVPPPAFESEFDLIALHYNLSLFAPMLQLLREESPVFMYWFDEMNAGLQTHLEPTGEEEHVPG